MRIYKITEVMRRFINLFALAATSAAMLHSCQVIEVHEEVPAGQEYVFAIGTDDETKAALGSSVIWADGDKVGTFVGASNNKYSTVTAAAGDAPASISVYASGGLTIGDKIYCYYPYSSDAGENKAEVTISVPVSQNEKDAMPMVSIPYTVEEASAENQTPYAGLIRFANLGAVMELNIYSDTPAYAEEKILSVEFNSDQAIAGSFTFDLTQVDYENAATLAISGYSEKSVVYTPSTELAVASTKADATIVNLVVAPGSYTGEIVVKTDKAIYTYPVSTAKEFKRSVAKPLGLNLRENVRAEINTVTFDFTSTDELEALGIVLPADGFGTNIEAVTKDKVTMTAAGGGTNTRIWNAKGVYDLRVYAGATLTFTVPSGYVIDNVTAVGNTVSGITYPLFPSNPAKLTVPNVTQKVNTITVVYRQGEIVAEPLTMSEVSCTSQTSSSLVFSWDAVTGAEGYKVSVDGGSTYGDIITATTYTWNGLDSETKYTLYVKAIADGVNALDSEPVTASGTTLEAVSVIYPVTDVLNKAFTGNPGSYTNWSGKTSNSPAVYAGNSSGGYSSIQLRATNQSGIVTTTSGGYAANIEVTWNNNTTNGRSLNIYGKSTPYESTEDFSDPLKCGVLIGTITYGESTTLLLGSFYEYIGIKVVENAVYLTDIEITWTGEKSPVVLQSLIVENPKTLYTQGDDFEAPVVKAKYTDATTKTVSANFTGFDSSTVGEQTINVSYTEEETTVYASYDINVIAPITGQEATLSFADDANRTSQDSNQQIWEQDGIRFINNKASSTSSVVADYSPVKLYKNSEVIIQKSGMTKIVFNCNSTSYASALFNAINNIDGVNVSVDSKVVTVIFAEAKDEFTMTMSGGQVRLDALTVTYN